jgi:hypothetical protein
LIGFFELTKMVAAPTTAASKPSGKQIKSKNQYKREKAKLKKATASQASTPVGAAYFCQFRLC